MDNYKIYSLAAITATHILIDVSDKYDCLSVQERETFYNEKHKEIEETLNLKKEILIGEGSIEKAFITEMCKQIVLSHLESKTAHKVMIVSPLWIEVSDRWTFESTLIEEVSV